MKGSKLIFCNVLYFMTMSKIITRAEEYVNSTNNLNETVYFEIFPGIQLFLIDNGLEIKVKFQDLLIEKEVARKDYDGNKFRPLRRIGSWLMMVPFMVQMLSLPGAIASIKMSLLRSIAVGKLAIVLLIYNAIKSLEQPEEVVVIHQPHHQHQHYYNAHHDYTDDDEGWLGS